MGSTPAIHKLDRITNGLVDRISTSPRLRRFRADRLPRRVRDVIMAALRDPEQPGVRERQRARVALEAADTLLDDIPPDLRHCIADPCLILAYQIRADPSYRSGISARSRLARQLFRVGRFHEEAEA